MTNEGSGPFSLEGRVAVVTGGGGWLGSAICEELAAAGAAVAVAGRTAQTLDAVCERVRDAGGRAIAAPCDLIDKASIDEMTRTAIGELGEIDILINNAAIVTGERTWMEIGTEDWDETFDTNVRGYLYCAQAAFPSMANSGRGRIINLSSRTVDFKFPNTNIEYVTSKSGVEGFTRALAREVGHSGVTVNAISPGPFDPPPGSPGYWGSPEYERWILEHQSLPRRGVPADIGHLAVFLASDAASFITGQTIAVDGGWQ